MIAALRFLPYAVSGLAVAAVWWLWADRASLQAENARLVREAAVAARVAEQTALAHDLERAEAQRHEAAATEYAQLRENILKGDQDAVLPDWLADHIASLFEVGRNGN